MNLYNKKSDLGLIKTLRLQLSDIDTRVSNLSLNHDSSKVLTDRRASSLLRSLPPIQRKKSKNSSYNPRAFKSIDPGCSKEKAFLEKYFNLPVSVKSKKKVRHVSSKPKFHRFQPKILPRATRLDPSNNPVLITEEDMQKGIYSLVTLGIVSKGSEVFDSLSKENPPLVHSKVLLHNSSIQLEPLQVLKKKPKKQLNFIFSEPVIPKKQSVVEIIAKPEQKSFTLSIKSGEIIKDSVFEEFMKTSPGQPAINNIKQLESFSKQYSLPELIINSERLIENLESPLSLLENSIEILEIVQKIKEKDEQKKRIEKAALKIQCSWRRYKGAARMRLHRLHKGKVKIIEHQYKIYKKRMHTKQFAASLREARSNKFLQRQKWIQENWGDIKKRERFEVHIGSDLCGYPNPPNLEIFRIFLLVDPRVFIYYITLQYIDLEIIKYYELLLSLIGVDFKDRLEYLCPYTICRTTMSNTSKALYLSSHDLTDLKRRSKGKDLIYVPYQTNEFDELNGDFLRSPIMGTVSSVYQKYKNSSKWKTIYESRAQKVPGFSDYSDFEHFHERLTKLKEQTSGNLEILVDGKPWTGEKWTGTQEVNVKYSPSAKVLCCLMIDPEGQVTEQATVECIGSGFLFPQSLLDEKTLGRLVKDFRDLMKELDIFGYVSFWACEQGIIDFEIGVNNNLFINIFARSLLKGVQQGNKYLVFPEAADLEQEQYIDENSNLVKFESSYKQPKQETRCYLWLPYIYHQGLADQKIVSLFHMSRIESVLFNLSLMEGTIFLPYSSLSAGCIGVLAIGEDYEVAQSYLAQGLYILSQSLKDSSGNLESVAFSMNLTSKIESFQQFSEKNQYLVKLV